MCSIHSKSISISIYAKTRQVISMDRTKTHTFQSRSMYLSTFTWTFCVRVCVCVCIRARCLCLECVRIQKGWLWVYCVHYTHLRAHLIQLTVLQVVFIYLSLVNESKKKREKKKWIKTTHSIGHWQEFSRHKQVIWWDSCARPCKCVPFHSVQRLAQFPIGIIIILIQWISCVGIALNSIPHNRAMNIYFIFCCCCRCGRCCFHSIQMDI